MPSQKTPHFMFHWNHPILCHIVMLQNKRSHCQQGLRNTKLSDFISERHHRVY